MAAEMSAAAVKAFEEAEAEPLIALAASVASAVSATSAALAAPVKGVPKKMDLGTEVVVWHNPESEGKEETEIHRKILTYYGMESLMDNDNKKMEMLRAFYRGTCQTHQTILQSAHCEPVRAILQTLAMRWLNDLVPDETRTTLSRLNASTYPGTLGSSAASMGASAASASMGASAASASMGASAASASMGASATSDVPASFSAHVSAPGSVGSLAPYTYQRKGDYIIITTDEFSRTLCADLKGMVEAHNPYPLPTEAHVSAIESSANSLPLQKRGMWGERKSQIFYQGNDVSPLTEEAVAATVHFQKNQALQEADAVQQQAEAAQQQAQLELQEAKQQHDSAAIAAAQTALAAAQAEVVAARAERNAASVQAATVQAERNAAATAQLAAKNSELAAQRKNAEALAAQHTQSLADLTAARASLNALEAQGAAASMADVAEREAAEERVRAAEAQVASLTAERNQSRASLVQAQANVAAAQQGSQQLMNAVTRNRNTAQANVARLQAELVAAQQAAQQEIAAISGNRNAALTNVARLTEELATEQAAAETLALKQATEALRQEEEDRAAATAVAAQRKQEAEAATVAQEAAAAEVQRLQAELEAVSGDRNATRAEVARIQDELVTAREEAAQQAQEASAAAQQAQEAAVAAAQAIVVEEAAAAALVAQQQAEAARTEAVAAARAEVEHATAARVAEQAAAQAEAAQQEAQRIQEAANARVAELNAQLEAAQQATTQSTGNRNQSRKERNAARAEVARMKEELETAHTESATAQKGVEAARAEKEQAVQEAVAAQTVAEIAQVAATEAQQAAEAAQNAAVANAATATAARQEANAARNAATREAEAARQEAAEAQKEKEAAQEREATLQASLLEATARSEAASLAAQQSTNATQAQRAQWNQQAATAVAEQARIQAALDSATALREQREQEHQEALQAVQKAAANVQKERNIARSTVTLLQSQRNSANAAATQRATEQQERISQLEREIQEHNAAAAEKLEQLQQERNATLLSRNQAEARAAADLIASHEQALREKNEAIAVMEANRQAAEANRNAARAERNAIRTAARAEQERLLVAHQKELAAADAERQALSEQHAAALASGNVAHAEQLRQQQQEAEAAHQQALQDVMEQAEAVVKEHSATVEADKQAQEKAFEREKAAWAAQMEEVENNNLQLTSESRVAKEQAATAEREKTEAIAAAEAAAAASIAAAEAARQAAQHASASNRANKAAALTAQQEAEATAAEAEKKRAAAEEKATEAAARETSAQETARLAQEAAQKALADAEAARAKQMELEGQQAAMTQATQALQEQLAAAEAAQQAASEKIAEVEQARTANATQAATQSEAQRAEWKAKEMELEESVVTALAEATAKKQEADTLQASLDAKSAEYEKEAAEAKRVLEETIAAAQAEKETLEARHVAEMQKTLETVQQSEARVEKIQADMKRTHAAARSEQNRAHAAALEAQMVKLGEEKEAAMASLRVEKDTAVKALESTIASHKETMTRLTTVAMETQHAIEDYKPIIETHERQIAELEKRHRSEMALLQETTNQSIKNLVAMNEPLLLAAKDEAEREKQRAEQEIQKKTRELAQTTGEIARLTAENEKLQQQLIHLQSDFSKRLGVANLSAVPDPNVSFQPVSHEAVNQLITDLTRLYFLPWRSLLRHPIAIRAHDLREDDSMRECLQQSPLVTLFSPLPEEAVMRTLLGPTYQEYEQYQESDEANVASSSASSGGGEKAMQIDILLYYLIIGLRQAPIINQSDDLVAINRTVEQMKAFSEMHLAQNKDHIDRLQNSCGVKLADEHNKDSSLLTFLYLSSKTPQLGNARFQYEIEKRYQRSVKMTYSPTPSAFYDATGREIAKGGDRQTYHYGPFTKIYPPTANSQAISNDKVFVDAVENRLRAGEAVTVIGYGASGSGKTTTLVYAKHNGQPGLLAHVANRLIQSSNGVNGFTSCQVIIYELDEGTPEGQCRTFSPASQKTIIRTVLDKEGKATTYEIPVTDCSNATPFSYTIQEGRWANASRIPLEKEIVEYIDTKRNTAPTPNNPQSSRSHVICVLTFSRSEAKGGAPAQDDAKSNAVFIVCDFAGVENTFMCEDPRVRETIGVKALVDPMVDHVLRKVEADIRKNVREIADQDLVLTEKASSYLFGTQSILDTFTMIRNGCNDMYRKMDREFGKSVSALTDHTQISIQTHRHTPSHELVSYHAYSPVYQRMLDLYRTHVDSSFKIEYLHNLVRLLVWYTHSRIRFQTLFQSLVTREYDPSATKIMSKTQIEAYPQRALCDQRVKEGVFINDSLKRLRAFISTSVRKSLGTRTPPFLDECVPLQCDPHHLHCFGQGSREEVDGGPLARLIEKSVVGKKNTFCIFTVVNLSRDANNPPPIPYVDIGPLLTVREALYPLIPGKMNPPNMQIIRPLLNGVYQHLLQLTHAEDEIVRQFVTYASRIQQGGDDVPYDLEELLQKLINHNAITTIGTIEFTDSMAKYGATQITCAPSFVKGQVTQIDQRGGPSVSTTERRGPVNQLTRSGLITPKTRFASVALGGFTRVRRKANRRTRKRRAAK
jgi:hypothetical protein